MRIKAIVTSMMSLKILLVGIVLVGFIGIAGTAIIASDGKILGGGTFAGRGGCEGGGCGSDRDDGGNYPSCHRNNANDVRGSCYNNGTCPYYENRTS